jgi:hypothetical protein
MPSLRSNASTAPRFPLATQASAFFTMRSFSAAVNLRRVRFATLSTAPPLDARSRSRCSLSSAASRSLPGDDFGKGDSVPFSAHRYIGFQGELSHRLLAQGPGPATDDPPGVADHRAPRIHSEGRAHVDERDVRRIGQSVEDGPRRVAVDAGEDHVAPAEHLQLGLARQRCRDGEDGCSEARGIAPRRPAPSGNPRPRRWRRRCAGCSTFPPGHHRRRPVHERRDERAARR